MEVDKEGKRVSKFAAELCEAIESDKELSDIATHTTLMGLHTIWLGQDLKNKKVISVGEHLYKLGGNLQALAIIRMDRQRKN